MNELEWSINFVRQEDGSGLHELWLYDITGSGWKIVTFDDLPTNEEIAAALAMWRLEHPPWM